MLAIWTVPTNRMGHASNMDSVVTECGVPDCILLRAISMRIYVPVLPTPPLYGRNTDTSTVSLAHTHSIVITICTVPHMISSIIMHTFGNTNVHLCAYTLIHHC